MSDDLRLGFHRLGRGLEDGVNMGAAIAAGWTTLVFLLAVATAADAAIAFALVLLGITVLLVMREHVAKLARRWRRERVELEQQRGGQRA